MNTYELTRQRLLRSLLIPLALLALSLVPFQVLAQTVETVAIHLKKTANPSQLPAGGGQVTYAYFVSNPGSVPLNNISATDNTCGPVTFRGGDADADNRLDTTEIWRFDCTSNITQTTTNIATARGMNGSRTAADTDSATVTVDPASPPTPPPGSAGIHLTKLASATSLPVGGGDVNYDFWVSNMGTVILENVFVTDDKCGSISLLGGDDVNKGHMDRDEVWHFRCTTHLTATTVNTATAHASFGNTHFASSDSILVTVAPDLRVTVAPPPEPSPPAPPPVPADPKILMIKDASRIFLPFGGGQVTYTYTVHNTGNVSLANVRVTDNTCGPVVFEGGDANGNGLLGTSETWTYSCTMNISQTTINKGSVSATWNGRALSDYDFMTVRVGDPPAEPAPPAEPSPPGLPNTGYEANWIASVAWIGTVGLLSLICTRLLLTSSTQKRSHHQ